MPATRDEIADAFERHVARYGYAKATVEDVAAELGVSKKTVYERFSSKREIYAYVVDRIATRMRGEIRQVIASEPTWGARVEALMLFVLRAARRHIEETSRADWEQEYEVAADALVKAIGDVTREVIADGINAGEVAFPDATLAEQLIAAVALRYTMMVRENPSLDVDDAVAAAARRFLG